MNFSIEFLSLYKHAVRLLFFLIAAFLVGAFAQAQSLACNAGNNSGVCPNTSGQLSATASGGTAPYNFHWEPAGYCTNANNANTSFNITATTNFTLTVIDASQDTCSDVVTIYLDDVYYFGAGPDKGTCYIGGSPVTIGDPDNYQGQYNFSWQPTSDLSNPNAPNPTATPSVTTTFTLTITSPSCGEFTDSVVVNVYQVAADAGPTITIDEGQTATLQGSGGETYFWSTSSGGMIKYENTANPDVNPTATTQYLMAAFDSHGCAGYDTVSVVVRPYNGLIIYNTFTPNGDGNNDTWVIGNLYKYPDNILEIYNRYGQLIYKKHNYSNDWNGLYLGEELPAGTYFYYLDTHASPGKFKGSVTIIR